MKMDKKQQIEEMAKIINELYCVYTTTETDIAEGIYQAGYRKIDENCVVITKDEWKEYQKQAYLQVFETLTNRLEKYYSQYYTSMAVIMQAITDEIQMIVLDKYCEHLNVAQEIKELKQRAVKEFAEKLKECAKSCKESGYDGINEEDIDLILKEYE